MSVTTQNNGMIAMVPQSMEQGIQLANMMSKSRLVPKHLQDTPADCFLIIEQAARWRMSPFAVAQCTSIVSGRLNFEGKLVAAALHTSGALSTSLAYEYAGAGDDRTITVSAVLAGETEPRTLTIRLGDVKTTNAMWTKQPDQQLAYSGARNWARRYAPEVMLGVYSPEEFDPVAPAPMPRDDFKGPTIEADPARDATPPSRDATPLYQRVTAAVERVQNMAATPANFERAERLTRPLLAELDAADMPAEREALVKVLSDMRAAADQVTA